jgi:hypothetical protein
MALETSHESSCAPRVWITSANGVYKDLSAEHLGLTNDLDQNQSRDEGLHKKLSGPAAPSHSTSDLLMEIRRFRFRTLRNLILGISGGNPIFISSRIRVWGRRLG